MFRSAIAGAAVLALAVPLAGPAVADVINGTDGTDNLRGTAGNDVIQGFGGDDALRGRGGNDALLGGAGEDVMWPGRGQFGSAEGGADDDRGYATADFTYMEGNQGDDLLMVLDVEGQNGQTYLRGNEGADILRGGRNFDGAEPDHGADIMRLGGRQDYVFIFPDAAEPGAETAVDKVFCGPGRDTVELVGGVRDPNDEFHDCENFIGGDDSANRPKWAR
jgi:hypothetical protein